VKQPKPHHNPLEHAHYDGEQERIVECAGGLWQEVKNLNACQWEDYQEKVQERDSILCPTFLSFKMYLLCKQLQLSLYLMAGCRKFIIFTFSKKVFTYSTKNQARKPPTG